MPFDEEELDPHGECAAEIARLTDDINLLKAAIHFAHEQGFQWPADPFAFLSNSSSTRQEKP